MQSFRWRLPGRLPLPPRGAQGAAATPLQPELLAHPRVLAPQQPLTRLDRNPARQVRGLPLRARSGPRRAARARASGAPCGEPTLPTPWPRRGELRGRGEALS